MSYEQLKIQLTDPYKADKLLQAYAKTRLKDDSLAIKDIERFSQRVMNEAEPLSLLAEKYTPTHQKYLAWGESFDDIQVHESWHQLDKIAAEEGLIAIAYERKQGALSRPYQFIKNFLFHPSSAYYSCPLAMTDGAAKLLENFGNENLKTTAFAHLCSRNPESFWTSGQWMTEQKGGSDVGQSETTAELKKDEWRISGKKWFTSATTSQMTMLLARTEKDDKGQYIQGSKGLSLFFARVRNDKGIKSPEIEVLRLKDKMGTKALPTAELQLNDLPGILVGERGKGIKTMSTLFNVSRINNACASISTSARMLLYAKQYAEKRTAFGKKLQDHPLHKETLEECEANYFKCFALGFFSSELLGQSECEPTENTERLLRLITPITKLYTAKKNIEIVSECIESIGGAAYMEDVGLAKYYRDSQVLSIWEGTTNILSLDVLRALHKEEALPALKEWLQQTKEPEVDLETTKTSLLEILDYYLKQDQENQEKGARRLSFEIAEVVSKVWLSRLRQQWDTNELNPIVDRALLSF